MTSYQTAYDLQFVARDGRNFRVQQDAERIGLRVDFSIDKNSKQDLNKATVGITNPSDKTLGTLQSEGIVRLQAGYSGDIATILVGEKESISIQDDGGTRRAEITVIEGNTSATNLNFSKNYGVSVTTVDIINDLVQFLIDNSPSIDGANAFTIADFNTYTSTQIVFGNALKKLGEFLSPLGYGYWINNGVITIIPTNGFTQDIEVLINSRNGMIGSPKKISETDEKKNSRNGVEIESVLNYNFDVGRRIRVQSRDFDNQIFRIDAINFSGDSFSGNWNSSIKAFDINE